jgi:hypothetical protein
MDVEGGLVDVRRLPVWGADAPAATSASPNASTKVSGAESDATSAIVDPLAEHAEPNGVQTAAASAQPSAFPFNARVNAKIALWYPLSQRTSLVFLPSAAAIAEAREGFALGFLVVVGLHVVFFPLPLSLPHTPLTAHVQERRPAQTSV